MALHREIDWTAAMRDMRADRTKPVRGSPASRSLELARLDRLAEEAAAVPFVSGGSFNRSAIMTAAVAQARLMRAKGDKAPWSKLMGFALRFAWICAKQQRAMGAH